VLLTTVSNVLSYLDLSVTPHINYYYRVVAVNIVGAGPYSNEAHALGR
jgi:hypothetical protein